MRVLLSGWRGGIRFTSIFVVALALGPAAAGGAGGQGGSVQERIDAARPGDVVELPAETIQLDEAIVIDKPLTLAGHGMDDTVLRAAEGAEGVLLRVQNVDGVRLADFTLDAADEPGIEQGIVLANGSDHRLERLHIRNIPDGDHFGPHAIYASSNVVDSVFTNLEIANIGPASEWGAGIRIGEGGRGNLIRDNRLRNLGRGGILTTRGSTDTRIVRNEVREHGFAGPELGIEVWGSGERVVIAHNRVDHWISVDGQQDVAVRHNTITGSDDANHIGSYGLELVNSDRVIMTDNTMEGGNHIGASVSNVQRKDLAYWARNDIRNSETWGAQIQGEEGGAHRMYFYRNTFAATRRSDRSLYPGAAGHGFRFNGNGFQIVLDSNRLMDNAGAGVQLGGSNLERLSFTGNFIADNEGPAVTGDADGDYLLWRNNDVRDNAGGDDGLTTRGFDDAPTPELDIEAIAAPAGERTGFTLAGHDDDHFAEVLWDLGDGIPRTGAAVEHAYSEPGEYRIAAIAWPRDGRAILVEATVTIPE